MQQCFLQSWVAGEAVSWPRGLPLTPLLQPRAPRLRADAAPFRGEQGGCVSGRNTGSLTP